MNNNISCSIVRDLLPSYLDELTSEETTKSIEDHLAQCDHCRDILEKMRTPIVDEEEAFREKQELDFLKKNRRKMKLLAAVACIVVIIGFVAGLILPLFKEKELTSDELSLNLLVGDVTIDNNTIKNGRINLDTICKSDYGIRNVTFTEEKGVVTIHVIGAREKWNTSPFYVSAYNAKDTIKAIRFEGNTLWEDGISVSEDVLDVYKTAHPYVGDASQNGETLSELKTFENLGDYTIELKTEAEPYGMIISLTNEPDDNKIDYAKKYMGFTAYNCLAVIENLSYVTFQYPQNGKQCEETWDLARAKQELDKDIKEFGKSEISLQTLQWAYYK